jgi:GMP synthase-like glutamine amidotransferase
VPPPPETASSQFAGGSSAVTVQRSDINQLAAAVKLGSSASVGKEVWARETPVAKRLLNGLCDCEQRNWLIHFVETGDQAMAGSQQYSQSVQHLAKLRRDDLDLPAH